MKDQMHVKGKTQLLPFLKSAKDEAGRTPIEIAQAHNHREICELLQNAKGMELESP